MRPQTAFAITHRPAVVGHSAAERPWHDDVSGLQPSPFDYAMPFSWPFRPGWYGSRRWRSGGAHAVRRWRCYLTTARRWRPWERRAPARHSSAVCRVGAPETSPLWRGISSEPTTCMTSPACFGPSTRSIVVNVFSWPETRGTAPAPFLRSNRPCSPAPTARNIPAWPEGPGDRVQIRKEG